MASAAQLFFPPFRLDLVNTKLWRDADLIPLKPKTFAVLRCLVEQPGQVVTKAALLEAVWSNTWISENNLKVHIRALREALGDDTKAPRFIETIYGQGYRWIGKISGQPSAVGDQPGSSSTFKVQSSRSKPLRLPSDLVGREAEFAQLHGWWEKARNGQPQMVFVTGEPGIGKTTLIEAFLESIEAEGGAWVARGQCVEHYGAGEAYMPVLAALSQLCRESGDEQLVALLHRYAPLWLAQMPSLIGTVELEELQRKVLGATQDRMLREMIELVAALTAQQALVLWLDDLHWSDYSTLMLLSALAPRHENGRFIMIGSFRPVEVLGNGHPLPALLQELHTHRQCTELALTGLPLTAVETYVEQRFPEQVETKTLAQDLYQRTEGNPLFLVSMVDELSHREEIPVQNGRHDLQAVLTQLAIPYNLRQLIARQFERLTPTEQQLLSVASGVGMVFSATAVAAALDADVQQVETLAESLVHRTAFLQSDGQAEGIERRLAARYRFCHALYLSVLQERLPPTQRRHLHQQIGKWKEGMYGERAPEMAAELAVHFEHGRDYQRALQYRQIAAENALQRNAYHEATDHLSSGLSLVQMLPTAPERLQHELTLRMSLGACLVTTKGYAAPEVETNYLRARQLCEQVGTPQQLAHALSGLCEFYNVRAEFSTAYALGRRLWQLAHTLQHTDFALSAHMLLGVVLHYLGRPRLAQRHHARGVTLCERHRPDSVHAGRAQDPGVFCLGGHSVLLWYLGYPEQALAKSAAALSLARGFAHPHNLALALSFGAEVYNLRRDGSLAQADADQMIALSREHAFPFWETQGLLFRGGALIEQGHTQEGIAQLQHGLEGFEATGARIDRPHFLALLADAYRQEGRPEEGLATLAKAFTIVRETHEHLYEPELYRLQGELTLQQFKVASAKFKVEAEAESCFRKAIDIARQQKAKSLELRAVMSLSRLWQRQGKRDEAQKLLAEMYGWFTEGFDTKDLTEAKELLETL